MLRDFQKRLFIRVGVALGIFAVTGIAILLLGRDMGMRTEGILAVQSVRNATLGDLKELARLRDESGNAERGFITLRNSLPNRSGLFEFRRKIEKEAADRNLGISFSFGAESMTDANISSIGFSMSLRGKYDDIMAMLKLMESNIFVNISSIEMSGSSAAYDANTQGNLFFSE